MAVTHPMHPKPENHTKYGHWTHVTFDHKREVIRLWLVVTFKLKILIGKTNFAQLSENDGNTNFIKSFSKLLIQAMFMMVKKCIHQCINIRKITCARGLA